ncbi:Piwi-domain-containing protein [Saitoella complicata NRRL Y-17804]|uniref:Piwi-domain-containing protein n=1 Tax=Saitoella complicata (strain BCRC 22490 / CBS 7301 / JCM 7358 / NBRC 10748 / NRRL Y-17804) TaxID=698492 RepID=UPI00086703A4|nr:Piwi-domain-containing protein [Saitoella complicata NRRL Y-17804]ODQ54664.1 Piwi-domain-containing protein [Saitoella complicata NRRL Y-17804]
MEPLSLFLHHKHSKDTAITEAITFLSHLIRQTPSSGLIPIRSSFFTLEGGMKLGDGLEVLSGIFQSARPAFGRMGLNVDAVMTAFLEGHLNVLEYAKLVLNARRTEDVSPGTMKGVALKRAMKILNRFVRGLVVYVKHRGPSKEEQGQMLKRVVERDATKLIFDQSGRDGSTVKVSVTKYMLETYNVRLQHPTAFVAETMSGAHLPLELAFIFPGQKFKGQLSPRQLQAMIKIACTRPNERFGAIRRNVERLDWSGDMYLKHYGMTVSKTMVTCDARLLPPPKIVYGRGKGNEVVPRGGQWNLRDKKLIEPKPIIGMGMLIMESPRVLPAAVGMNWLKCLQTTARNLGMGIQTQQPPVMHADMGDVERDVERLWRATGNAVNSKPTLLIFVVPSPGQEVYLAIKHVCDLKFGVASQVVVMKHVQRPSDQYCANLLMKINVKLGGVNVVLSPDPKNVLQSAKETTLLLGADVSHPPPGSGGVSLASLVGSTNVEGTKYAAVARAQEGRLEMIADMQEMTMQLLRSFYKGTHKKPTRIIYFRDGVSEGQFRQCLDIELAAIKQACEILEHGYSPKITVVIAQKRHNTRFQPATPQGGDQHGNVIPGTCVDNGVTHPSEFDFYLHVIHDENNFRAADFQKLVHDLCYVYARSTTSVSLVPVTYYAHIVGNRVKAHLNADLLLGLGSETATEVSGHGEREDARVPELPQVEEKLRGVMWFM